MSKKFWFSYTVFFVFIFPLFFSYTGSYIWSPVMSTISLAIGLVGWIGFISWIYLKTIAQPKKMQRNIHSLMQKGNLIQGKVLDTILLKKNKNNSEDLEIVVEFKNLSNTPVKQTFNFTDSKPHERRYETGNNINLRISAKRQSPGVIIADTKTVLSLKFGIIALVFVFLYMTGTFLVHYSLFSNGTGWRFITLWHPWVFTPYFGLFLFNVMGRGLDFFSTNSKTQEQFILYGRKAKAFIQRADQTGMYINEQPQIKFVLRFTDYAGQPHTVTLKKIVPLTQLHTIHTGTQNILYLPDNPEKIIFVD